MQLADRDRLIIAAMGDGPHLFSTSIVWLRDCRNHEAAGPGGCREQQEMERGADGGRLGFYPHGYASKMNVMRGDRSFRTDRDRISPNCRRDERLLKLCHGRANLIKELEKAVDLFR